MPRELVRFVSTIKTSTRAKLNQHRFALVTGELIGEHARMIGALVGAPIGEAALAAGIDVHELSAGVRKWLLQHPLKHVPVSFEKEIAAIEARLPNAVDDDLARLQDCLLRVREAQHTIARRELTAKIVATRSDVQELVAGLARYCKRRWGIVFRVDVPLMPAKTSTVRAAGCRAG